MSRHPFLESFDPSASPAALRENQDQERLETIRSTAYEKGYASGWEDAVSSENDARSRVEAEFERNIQNLAFTFAEAVNHVRGELRDFVSALIDQFLPAISQELIREHVKSELLKVGETLTAAPVQIVASSDCNQIVQHMLSTDFSDEFVVVEDSTLSRGQVFVRLGKSETVIDLTSLFDNLAAQFKAMCETEEDVK